MLLNRKGRILADRFVLALEDGLLLDTAPGMHAEVRQVLERHIIADDVGIHDLSEAWGHVGLEGPGVRSLLESESMPLPAPGRFVRTERDGETFLWVGDGSLTPEGLQVLGPRAPLAKLEAGLGLPGLSEEEVEVLRIEGFLPVYGIDMTEQNSPVEARLEHAVSYTKGCFVGQEILARIRSHGAVKRLLVQVHAEAPVKPGASIRAGGTVVGEVTSAAVSPLSGPMALGYVRSAEAAPGTLLDLEGVPGRVAGPPLD
jgi:folate-binding protein YgfZ